MARLLERGAALDTAVYAAIAGTETPGSTSRCAASRAPPTTASSGSATAAAIALLGGPGGRRAAPRRLLSLALASGVANLVAKPLTARRRPDARSSRSSPRARPMPSRARSPPVTPLRPSPSPPGPARRRPLLSAPLRALATLVGYSRVHTGVHYPADVLAGAFIGVSAAELTGRMLDRR